MTSKLLRPTINLLPICLLAMILLPAMASAQVAEGPDGRPLGATAVAPPQLQARTGIQMEVFRGSDADVPGAYPDRTGESLQTALEGRSFVAGALQSLQIDAAAPAFSFRVAENGNVGFGTQNPEGRLQVVGIDGARSLMLLDHSGNLEIGGVLSEASSRLLKENIQPVDQADVLARLLELPINSWSYTADAEGIVHMGPMAQDFHAAFGLGSSPEAIAVLDASGVTMAAVQSLARQVELQASLIRELQESNRQLTDRIKALERN